MEKTLIADFEIRQLHARFINAVWRQDAADFASCFASDGVWKIAGMEMTGRDAIAEGCGKLLGRCEKIQLIVQPSILDIQGETAIGRHHMIEYAKMLNDGGSFMTFGIYYDTYALGNGHWFFQRRHWSMHYRGPMMMGGDFVNNEADYGAFPGMPSMGEPTYVRPAS